MTAHPNRTPRSKRRNRAGGREVEIGLNLNLNLNLNLKQRPEDILGVAEAREKLLAAVAALEQPPLSDEEDEARWPKPSRTTTAS